MWTGILPTHKATGITITPPSPIPKEHLGLLAMGGVVPNIHVLTRNDGNWSQEDHQIHLDAPIDPLWVP